MRKKGEEVAHLTLCEAGNSDRVSSRPVIYDHNSNSINIAIVIRLMETIKFIILRRPKQTSQHTDCWKLTDPVYAL